MVKDRKVKFFRLFYSYDANNLQPGKIDLYCRWLYQTPRADGNPRVLLFGQMQTDSESISFFLNRIKQVSFLGK
jgi:hypothetical protein